jgi:hypothetical protein
MDYFKTILDEILENLDEKELYPSFLEEIGTEKNSLKLIR